MKSPVSKALLAINFFIYISCCAVSILVIPKFSLIFIELGIKLPFITAFIVDYSAFIGLGMLAVMIAMVIIEFTVDNTREKTLYNFILLFIGLGVIAIFVSGLFYPLITIIDKLGTDQGG